MNVQPILLQQSDVAKCAGIGCSRRSSCLRYLSDDAGARQRWASFYVDLPGCGAYVPSRVDELECVS